MLLLLSIAASMLVVGCGGGATIQPSASTTHPSPSPTPTALSQRQQLVLYLREFAKYGKRETALVDRDNRIYKTVNAMSQGDNYSAVRARLAKVAQGWNDLSVVCAAMNPPRCVAASHWLLVRYLPTAYFSDLAYYNYLAPSGTNSDYRRVTELDSRARSEFRAWSFTLRVVAMKLHVRIPFSIKET